MYPKDSHDSTRVRRAIKVKVKSGNFQTSWLNHAGVPDLCYTKIGEIVSCRGIENLTFYERYDRSRKINLFLFMFFGKTLNMERVELNKIVSLRVTNGWIQVAVFYEAIHFSKDLSEVSRENLYCVKRIDTLSRALQREYILFNFG